MDFFGFLGSYWWVVFPVMGMLGAAGGAWERGARARHERRLEILQAKGRLQAGVPGTTDAGHVGAGSGSGRPSAAPLRRLLEEHDAITARWLEYELDVAKVIAFPAMSDGRQPLTAAFLRAKRRADGLRPPSSAFGRAADSLAEYRDAVDEFATAFEIAERDARRVRDSSFTEAERKRLATAQQLLSVAIDQAATPAERQLAYRRVREELNGLIALSDEAIEVLEEAVALELTTGDGALPGPSGDESTAADAGTLADTGLPASASSPHHPPGRAPAPAPRPTSPPGRVTRPRPR